MAAEVQGLVLVNRHRKGLGMERYQPDQYGRMMPDAHGQWVSLRAAEITALDAAQKSSANAQATVEALQKKYDDLLGKYRQLMDFYDKHNGTPCEQIRHQQQVKALQRERQQAEQKHLQDVAYMRSQYDSIVKIKDDVQTALDTVREKAARLEAAANYYKQPSKNGGVYSVSGGHIGNLMDWCKDNLKHCKFSGPDVEGNLDLDLVQTAQQIPQLKTELSQLQALMRALPVVIAIHVDCSIERYVRYCTSEKLNYECAFPSKEYAQAFVKLLEYRATLDATTPARGQELEDK